MYNWKKWLRTGFGIGYIIKGDQIMFENRFDIASREVLSDILRSVESLVTSSLSITQSEDSLAGRGYFVKYSSSLAYRWNLISGLFSNNWNIQTQYHKLYLRSWYPLLWIQPNEMFQKFNVFDVNLRHYCLKILRHHLRKYYFRKIR